MQHSLLSCPGLSQLDQCLARSQEHWPAKLSHHLLSLALSGPRCPHFPVEVYRGRGFPKGGPPGGKGSAGVEVGLEG